MVTLREAKQAIVDKTPLELIAWTYGRKIIYRAVGLLRKSGKKAGLRFVVFWAVANMVCEYVDCPSLSENEDDPFEIIDKSYGIRYTLHNITRTLA